jgi:hypothetical protein
VHDVFARAHAGVEGDRGVVAVVGLDVNDPGAGLAGDGLQALDERARDAAAAVRQGDGEI